MRTIVALALMTTAAAQSAPQPIGPPSGFFGSAPNVGGTLYLKFCTAAGWPCRQVEQRVWGQICYAAFADSYGKEQESGEQLGDNHTIWPFTHYAGWSCPGTSWTDEQHKIGYSDGGPRLP